MINGAFGVGKTSVSEKLVNKIPNSMIYDPEEVGVMLKNIIPDNMKTLNETTDDFQDLDMWRKLVVTVASELINKYKKTLIVPITIKKQETFNYIYNGFKSLDEQVIHYCLIAPLSEVENRLIKRGESKGSWAFQKAFECVEIFNNMFLKDNIDTSNKNLEEVVNIIYEKLLNINDKYFLAEFLGERFYTIKAKELDLMAINSAHQRIRNIVRKKPYCEVVVENNPLIIQQQLDIGDLEKYLKSTKNIKCDSSEVNNLIKIIVDNEKRKNVIINKVATFTRGIKNHNEVFNMIFYGETKGELNLEYGKNDLETMYECTSVFIALMRNIGIPCKFILGKSDEKTNHSWAEVFIKEQGWIPVETENNNNRDDIENWYFGVTNKHVKILEGVDYENVDFTMKNMNLDVKLII
ncbi:MAG: transglutaminase-like domain-containing protein [Clostridium sp.]